MNKQSVISDSFETRYQLEKYNKETIDMFGEEMTKNRGIHVNAMTTDGPFEIEMMASIPFQNSSQGELC